MRQFYLLNGNGEKFDLMAPTSFFHAPDGLGSAKTQSFLRIGDFYKRTENYETQKAPNGEMIFRNYEDYHTFAMFIQIEPLILVYKPIDTEYRLNCTVSKFEKSEIDHKNNRLICPITFTGTSKWYNLRSAITAHPFGKDAKRYPYTYDYQYYNSLAGILEGTNNSPNEIPCILYIEGYCVNPSWVVSTNNKQISSGSVSVELIDGEQLVVNSRDDNLEIAKYTLQNEYISNLYQDAAIDKENFIYLPSGNFKITVRDESLSSITAHLELLEEYDTV